MTITCREQRLIAASGTGTFLAQLFFGKFMSEGLQAEEQT
jgi:hypothetical protein